MSPEHLSVELPKPFLWMGCCNDQSLQGSPRHRPIWVLKKKTTIWYIYNLVAILFSTFLPAKGERPSAWPDVLNTDITPSDGLCQTGGLWQRSHPANQKIKQPELGDPRLARCPGTVGWEDCCIGRTHPDPLKFIAKQGNLLPPPYIRGNRRCRPDTGCPQGILPDCYHSLSPPGGLLWIQFLISLKAI